MAERPTPCVGGRRSVGRPPARARFHRHERSRGQQRRRARLPQRRSRCGAAPRRRWRAQGRVRGARHMCCRAAASATDRGARPHQARSPKGTPRCHPRQSPSRRLSRRHVGMRWPPPRRRARATRPPAGPARRPPPTGASRGSEPHPSWCGSAVAPPATACPPPYPGGTPGRCRDPPTPPGGQGRWIHADGRWARPGSWAGWVTPSTRKPRSNRSRSAWRERSSTGT